MSLDCFYFSSWTVRNCAWHYDACKL